MKFLIRLSPASGSQQDAKLELDADFLTIGFAKDNGLVLETPGAADHHARISGKDGQYRIEALTDDKVLVNERSVDNHLLVPGDVIRIGSSLLRVMENGRNQEFRGEMITPKDLKSPELRGNFLRWGWDGQHIAYIRPLIWTAVIVALAFFLLIPLASIEIPAVDRFLNRGGPLMRSISGDSWSVGPVSRYHIRIANDCEKCHAGGAFTDIPNKACESCHDDIKNHVNVDQVKGIMQEMPLCGDCHQEHIADNFLVMGDRVEQCLQCHGDIKKTYSKSELRNIPKDFGHESLFGGHHPEFKASVVNNQGNDKVTIERISMADKEKLVEQSGLRKFSHRDHMAKEGVLAPDGKGGAEVMKLECWSCHKSDPNDGHMSTASFNDNCHQCHKLTFDQLSPNVELPHGKAEDIFGFLKDFYAKSPRGSLIDLPPNHPDGERTLPGKLISRGSVDFDAGSFTLDQYAKAMGQRTFENGVCSECHQAEKPTDDFSTWRIVKPKISTHWFPKAKFNHNAHDIYECGGCHDAAQSESPKDVNIRGQESCTECHSSENSSCLKCHSFHSEGHFKMNGDPLLPKKEEIKPWHGQALMSPKPLDAAGSEVKK